jgi:hypothetical protein
MIGARAAPSNGPVGGDDMPVIDPGHQPGGGTATTPPTPVPPAAPRRFHGSVPLNPRLVGSDAGRVAEEVIAHLAGLVGAKIKVTLEIEAELPDGAPEQVVRIVTENSRTLKFTNQGFESE